MEPIWTPSPERIARANLTRFIAQVRSLGEDGRAESVHDFESLYEWSIRNVELFWLEVRRFGGIVAGPPDPDIACERVLVGRDRDGAAGPGARTQLVRRHAAQLRRKPAALPRRSARRSSRGTSAGRSGD